MEVMQVYMLIRAEELKNLGLYEKYVDIVKGRNEVYYPELLVLIDEDIMQQLGIQVTITE